MTIDTAEHERDAAYRHALAEYHASLRENFINFLWTRPAHESFTPERNGGRPAPSNTRSKPSPPQVNTTPEVAEKKERSPLLETSRNVVNPLTGKRWVDSRDPRHGHKTQQEIKGYVAPPMERSVPIPAPTIIHAAPLPPPAPRQHTLPVRPLVKRQGTSSSSFGIRGRVHDHSPSLFPGDKGLGGGWKARGNRSFHGFRRRSSSVSSTSSETDDSQDEDDHHTPPALSHRSSSSSLAITSPTAPLHRTQQDEPMISNVPRHSIDDHYSPSPPHPVAKSHLRLPAVPAVSPFGELVAGMHSVGMAGTPGTTRTEETEGTEASWAALAPSPL